MICAVCFTDPSSELTVGYNAGIITLLVVITLILIAFAFWFRSIYKRNRRISC